MKPKHSTDPATRHSSRPRPTSRKLAPANQAGVLGRLADWKDAPGTLLVHTQDPRDGDVRRSKVRDIRCGESDG
jgi:hypothetical protein